MKNKIFALLAILAVFGLAIATYAYNRTSTTVVKASCCKNADSCPMKGKDGEHGKGHAMGGDHNCCDDRCPMKKDGGDHAKMEGHNCCGDSCPMKEKAGEAKAAAVSASDGKNCCDSCDCCKGKAKAETAAV